MATDLIDHPRTDFVTSLAESVMIEVQCLKGSEFTTIRFPSTIACAFSKQFKILTETKYKFEAAELLGETEETFNRKTAQPFYELMLVFIKWLHTSEVYPDGCHAGDLWVLGQKLQVPKFQNHVLRSQARFHTLVDGSATYYRSYFEQYLREVECISHRPKRISIYHDENKLLKFIIDCFVYRGFQNEEFGAVIEAGGANARQLVKLLYENRGVLRKAKYPPWHALNINDYLLEEPDVDGFTDLTTECDFDTEDSNESFSDANDSDHDDTL